jgi:NAD(P)-dependent dehydrogenase (short-subunit alcohol dehydrogenase family)
MTVIAGRKILVTGANRGLGREFVAQFLGRGAGIVYAAARNPSSVHVTDERVIPIALDVTDPHSVAAAATAIGDIDIVVNNAGVATPTSVLSTDSSALRRELEVNLFGPLTVTAAFAEPLASRGGAVVNVASALAWIGLGASYGVSKAALWSATDSMRLELGPRGVQVLGVYMGYVDTDMAQGVTAPKSSPADIVSQVLDGLEDGTDEVLADATAREVRAGLSMSTEQRYAPFTGSPS